MEKNLGVLGMQHVMGRGYKAEGCRDVEWKGMQKHWDGCGAMRDGAQGRFFGGRRCGTEWESDTMT